MTIERLEELKDWFKRIYSKDLPSSLNYQNCRDIEHLIHAEIERQDVEEDMRRKL